MSNLSGIIKDSRDKRVPQLRKEQVGPRIGLALGGGGARGIAHIPLIEAMDEMGLRPSVIAGTSIGAIVCVGLAAGMTGRDIRDAMQISVGSGLAFAGVVWKSMLPVSWLTSLSKTEGFAPFNIERIMGVILPDVVPKHFEDLAIPLHVVATDYYGQREVVFNQGPLQPALSASCALPGLFAPVTVNGRVMVDGGVMNPVPWDILRPQCDLVIGVDVSGGPEGDGTHPPGRLDAVFGASQLMMQANIALRARIAPPDLMWLPDVNAFGILDFGRSAEILAATETSKDQFKHTLEQQIEAFMVAR